MSVIKEFRSIQKEIKQLDEKIKELEALAAVPASSNLSGMPRSGRVTDGMDIMARVMDLKAMYARKKQQLLDMTKGAEAEIETLGSEERLIIRYRFIDGLSVRATARKAYCSPETVKRRTRAAMEKLEANGEIHN